MKKNEEIDNFTHTVSLEQIKREIECEFNLSCSKNALRNLAKKLNVLEAKKARIKGILKLQASKQIFLKCTITAKLIQPCSLTLDPVVTNIYKDIFRTFYIGSNSQAPTKKSVFELNSKSFDNDIILNEIDLGQVLMETISLETPDYPKKSGAFIDLSPIESIKKENPFSILSKLKK